MALAELFEKEAEELTNADLLLVRDMLRALAAKRNRQAFFCKSPSEEEPELSWMEWHRIQRLLQADAAPPPAQGVPKAKPRPPVDHPSEDGAGTSSSRAGSKETHQAQSFDKSCGQEAEDDYLKQRPWVPSAKSSQGARKRQQDRTAAANEAQASAQKEAEAEARREAARRLEEQLPEAEPRPAVNTPVVPSMPVIASGNMRLESSRALEAERKREELQAVPNAGGQRVPIEITQDAVPNPGGQRAPIEITQDANATVSEALRPNAARLNPDAAVFVPMQEVSQYLPSVPSYLVVDASFPLYFCMAEAYFLPYNCRLDTWGGYDGGFGETTFPIFHEEPFNGVVTFDQAQEPWRPDSAWKWQMMAMEGEA
ncbi:unnamed protein product [Symbiodinium natans]|uniref:Uncharacterized protein n=1 Tax=Symbiodinium natans TaxID=878477 RepID=A0A812TBG3_9DINO|nr:unnamed protein product [Symbiodinium natans]